MADRIDPNTGGKLDPADYRYAIRGIAFNLLAEGNYDALGALWGALSDDASAHFDQARHSISDEMKRYWQTRRRDCLDLLNEVEAAYQHCPDFPAI